MRRDRGVIKTLRIADWIADCGTLADALDFACRNRKAAQYLEHIFRLQGDRIASLEIR